MLTTPYFSAPFCASTIGAIDAWLSANFFACGTSTPAAFQIFAMNASVAYPEFSWPWLKYQSCVK